MPDPDKNEPITKLTGITIDVHDLEIEREFWRTVLNTGIAEENDMWVLFEPQLGQAGLSLQKVPEGKKAKNRAHPDLKMTNFEEGVRELERLGAKSIQRVSGESFDWVIMTDPDGNEFCAIE